MINKYYVDASKELKKKYNIDVVEDIFLGEKNRVLFFADVSNPENIWLHAISGNLTMIGFEDAPKICLSEILSKMDLNNTFAKVSGEKEYKEMIMKMMYSFSQTAGFSIPIKNGGQIRWLNFTTSSIFGHQDIKTIVVKDITPIMIEEEKNFKKTHVDSLTNLYNKYTFDYHYGLRYKDKDLHVMYLDLDDFKKVNDTFGHIIGNEFLVAFSKILEFFQNGNNLFYRIGGDEFVGLFFMSSEEVKKIASQILKKTRLIKIPLVKHYITVSIGIVKSRYGENLVRKADDALYEIKKSGKNDYRLVLENKN